MACHGRGGNGDAYRVPNPPPADLTSPAVQQKLDADLLKTIHDGRPNTAMGTWKWVLSGEEAREVTRVFAVSGTVRQSGTARRCSGGLPCRIEVGGHGVSLRAD